jgi:hypothetical protein
MKQYRELWEKLGVKGQVINLKERDDRAKSSLLNAQLIGLPIEIFTVERHPDGGEAGCFESHQKVCQSALDNGQKFALVFEDDFGPTVELMSDHGYSALKEAIEFVLTSNDWSIVYLGVLPNVWHEKSIRTGKHLYRVKPWSCTHAMIIHENYMREIVKWRYLGKGADAIDRRHRKCEKAYAFHPQAFKQIESPSDIRHNSYNFTGPIRDLPVNLASWYALNIGVSLGQSLIVFAVIVFLMSITSSESHYKKLAVRTLKRSFKPRPN